MNDAALPLWRAVPPRVAAEEALSAATEVDQFIEQLPAAVVEEAAAKGRAGMLDRSVHRRQHLDRVERTLR